MSPMISNSNISISCQTTITEIRGLNTISHFPICYFFKSYHEKSHYNIEQIGKNTTRLSTYQEATAIPDKFQASLWWPQRVGSIPSAYSDQQRISFLRHVSCNNACPTCWSCYQMHIRTFHTGKQSVKSSHFSNQLFLLNFIYLMAKFKESMTRPKKLFCEAFRLKKL